MINIMKNNKFLTLVTLVYIALGIAMPSKAIQSFGNSLYYIKEMLIIMPVILLLTSLIEAWVPKKTIQNALGEDSGFKGYIFAFLLGSFSAGPIYAAFPVCKTLFKKGTRTSNIVIILSTWAVIKVPMLANEAKFLGVKFTVIRWFLTTISIFLMAYLVGKIMKKEDVENLQNNACNIYKENLQNENFYIEQDYCIGCGLCVKLAPSNFVMENKKAKIINENLKNDNYESINDATDKCPSNAIKFTNKKSNIF